MKKFLTVVSAAVVAASILSFAACGEESIKEPPAKTEITEVTVVAPDGAPALALAMQMSEGEADTNISVDYQIVDSTTITAYVTGENPTADLCILPVNAASKLLGDGTVYQMLGSVTHGNLYLLSSKYSEEITVENLSSLAGKTVGVVQLSNVPGLVFKSILEDHAIEYNELGNEGLISETAINLKSIEGTDVGVLSDVDYYVAPEPAASTKVSKIEALNFVGDLQELYGGEEGYVQAVLVGKTEFIAKNPDYIKSFLDEMVQNEAWLQTAEASVVVEAVSAHLTEGLAPTFTAANLTSSVIANCGIRFEYSVECKEETTAIIGKFIAINSSSASVVSDDFFNTKFSR